MQRTLTIMRKEFIQLRRDPYSMTLLLVEPIVLLLIIAYALSTDVKHIPTVVWDQSRSNESRRLLESFQQSQYFDLDYHVDDQAAVTRLIDSGQAKAGLIIPVDYAGRLARGEDAGVQFIIDGSDPMVATSGLSYAMLVAQANAIKLAVRRLQIREMPTFIDFRPRVWYNPNMENMVYLTPGLVAVILVYVTLAMSSFAIVRERERGTLEQLIVTPIKPWELMVGKLLPYVLVSFADAGLMLLVATLFFGTSINGNILLLTVLSLVFIISMLALGIFISTVSSSQYQAQQWVIFMLVPPALLSGLIFPIEAMPRLAQFIAYLMPLTYYLHIVRGIILKGNGLNYLWRDTLILAVMGLLLMTLSVSRFHKRLE